MHETSEPTDNSGNRTKEREAAPRSLQDRIRDHANAIPVKKGKPALCKIIEVRDVLIAERQRGRSSDELAQILAAEGIHIVAGTVRNYLSHIMCAVETLASEGDSRPSNSSIQKKVNELINAGRKPVTSQEPCSGQDETTDQKTLQADSPLWKTAPQSLPVIPSNGPQTAPAPSKSLTRNPTREH